MLQLQCSTIDFGWGVLSRKFNMGYIPVQQGAGRWQCLKEHPIERELFEIWNRDRVFCEPQTRPEPKYKIQDTKYKTKLLWNGCCLMFSVQSSRLVGTNKAHSSPIHHCDESEVWYLNWITYHYLHETFVWSPFERKEPYVCALRGQKCEMRHDLECYYMLLLYRHIIE